VRRKRDEVAVRTQARAGTRRGGLERATCVVDRLAQVGAARRAVEVGPQPVGELLAVQPVARFEGEQLQHPGRLAAPPWVVGDRCGAASNPKSAEQLDWQPLRRHRGAPSLPGGTLLRGRQLALVAAGNAEGTSGSYVPARTDGTRWKGSRPC